MDDNRDQARRRLKSQLPAERLKSPDGELLELVVDDVRCDREFEDEETRRRREQWEAEQDARRRERQSDRSTRTLGDRLDRALFQLEVRQGTRARPIASTRGGGEGSPGGNRPSHVGGADVSHHVQLIDHHVRMIEEALDAEAGLLRREPMGDSSGAAGGMTNGRLMTTADRDRIVWEDFHGVRAEQVAEEAPYLGTSARTIERARAAEAERRGVRVRLVDGTVLGPAKRTEAA